MIPRLDRVAAIDDSFAVDRAHAEQGLPVRTEKYLIADQIPIPYREARADQRQVKPLFSAGYVALGAFLIGDVAAVANAVALPVDIGGAAMKYIWKCRSILAAHFCFQRNLLSILENTAYRIGHQRTILFADKVERPHL